MDCEGLVREIALDYIEGWYGADSMRMDRALHSKLVKRRFVGGDEIWDVDASWMVKATEEGRGKIKHPERGKRDITILDVQEKIAAVKIISEKFIDYLHLAKIGEIWQIVDVLWDYLPE